MPDIREVIASLTASPQQLTHLSTVSTERLKLAAYHAKLILGCYRTGDASDPEIFVTAITSVLSRYPADVGARLSDPKDGISGRIKWLPTVSEVREECDRLMTQDAAAFKRKSDLAEQWRLRDELEASKDYSKLTDVDPCNLFVRRDYRGFQQMLDAKDRGKIKHFRRDTARDGIHVNVDEYGVKVGFLRKGA